VWWNRWKKDREKAQDDPDVEYVDEADFKPGGKYGPRLAPPSSTTTTGRNDDGGGKQAQGRGAGGGQEDGRLSQATEKVMEAVLMASGGSGSNSIAKSEAPKFNSNLWAELLD